MKLFRWYLFWTIVCFAWGIYLFNDDRSILWLCTHIVLSIFNFLLCLEKAKDTLMPLNNPDTFERYIDYKLLNSK